MRKLIGEMHAEAPVHFWPALQWPVLPKGMRMVWARLAIELPETQSTLTRRDQLGGGRDELIRAEEQIHLEVAHAARGCRFAGDAERQKKRVPGVLGWDVVGHEDPGEGGVNEPARDHGVRVMHGEPEAALRKRFNDPHGSQRSGSGRHRLSK